MDNLAYDRIASALRWGVVIGVVFIVGGLGIFFLKGAGASPPSSNLAEGLAGLVRFDPGALILVGIIVVLALPVVQALLAAATYRELGNRRYTLVSLGVFVIQMIALAVAWLK